MKKKPAKVNFFKLVPGAKGGIDEFKENLSNSYDSFKKKDYDAIPTLEMNGDKYYIQAMEKRNIDVGYYYWLVTISRVDLDQEIIIADITKTIDKRRREIEHSENEGIVADTRLIFDPFRNILAVYVQRGTINTSDLRKFICNLVDKKGIQFQIILNENGYKRIDKLDIVNKISYKVASPDNFKSYGDESRSEFADFKFARSFEGSELAIALSADQLEKATIKSKVKDLLSFSDDLAVKALKVDGIVNGVEDTIDLIKNRLIYSGDIEYSEDIDDKAAYGLLNKAYDTYHTYLKKIYKVV